MKELLSQVKFSTKGELVEFNDNTIKTQIQKKNDVVEEEIDLTEFLADVTTFCNNNMGKNIEAQIIVKCIE